MLLYILHILLHVSLCIVRPVAQPVDWCHAKGDEDPYQEPSQGLPPGGAPGLPAVRFGWLGGISSTQESPNQPTQKYTRKDSRSGKAQKPCRNSESDEDAHEHAWQT